MQFLEEVHYETFEIPKMARMNGLDCGRWGGKEEQNALEALAGMFESSGSVSN